MRYGNPEKKRGQEEDRQGESRRREDRQKEDRREESRQREGRQEEGRTAEMTCMKREDPGFPERLRRLPDCPEKIYLRGELPPEGPAVAIVGARQCDAYGEAAASYFAEELAARGIAVISGMAAGIDACGQKAALAAGGYSLAVLGCGADICYPAWHRKLYDRLCREGGILSEFPPGAPPEPWHFPRRNRLISAFADAVLVVQARKKSGSLITADMALEQGKDVLAVPGRIGDALSEGCHHLIRQGAGIAAHIDDILFALGWEETVCPENEKTGKDSSAEGTGSGRKTGRGGTSGKTGRGGTSGKAGSSREDAGKRKRQALYSPAEKEVLGRLSHSPIHVDRLSAETGQDIPSLLLTLIRLESCGAVKQVSPGQYVRAGIGTGRQAVLDTREKV